MIVGAIIGVFVANPACNLDAFTAFAIPEDVYKRQALSDSFLAGEDRFLSL